MTWISSIASMCEIGPNFRFSETHFPGPIWLDLTKTGLKLSFEDVFTIIWPNGVQKMSFGKSEIWPNFAHTSDAGNPSHSYTSATYIFWKTLLWDLFFCKDRSDWTRFGEMARILVSKTWDFRHFCPLFGLFRHFPFNLFFRIVIAGKVFGAQKRRTTRSLDISKGLL